MSYGGVLYRDFFDHKGPVFLAFNALGWLLTGDAWGVWTIEFLFRLVAVGCFFVGAIRRIGTVGAFVGAIAFVFHPALANYPETFALDSSMMALGLVMMRPAADLSWIVVGLLGAAAVFSKQTCISVFFGLVVYLVLGRNWRPVLYSIVGGVATSALIVAAILFWGDVAAWWDCTYRFNALQGGHLRAVAIHKAILIVANTSLYWCVACVGLFLAVRGRIVGRRIIVSWVLAVVSEVVLLSCGSGPYFYQAYCLQFLLMLPGVVACAGWYRNDARVLGRCACVLICSAAVLGSMPNFARAMQNVAYLMHDDHQLAEGNGEMDYRAQMCRFLNSLPQGDLIVYDNYCRYFLETKHKCPIAPYYYSVPFLVPGYLNSSQMDDLEAKVASKDLIVVTRCELRDSHDGSMESILAARVSQPDITRIELPRCGTAYVAKKLLK